MKAIYHDFNSLCNDKILNSFFFETYCTIIFYHQQEQQEVNFIGQSIVRKVSTVEKDIEVKLITLADLNNAVIYEFYGNFYRFLHNKFVDNFSLSIFSLFWLFGPRGDKNKSKDFSMCLCTSVSFGADPNRFATSISKKIFHCLFSLS